MENYFKNKLTTGFTNQLIHYWKAKLKLPLVFGGIISPTRMYTIDDTPIDSTMQYKIKLHRGIHDKYASAAASLIRLT